MEEFIAGLALLGVGAIVCGFREWRRLTTFREQQAALVLFRDVIVAGFVVAYVAAIWFIVSPPAAVAAFGIPAVLVAGKTVAAFVQHLGYAWWERRLRIGIERNLITNQELQQYMDDQPHAESGEGAAE